MKFEFKDKVPVPSTSGHGEHTLYADGKPICYYLAWAFSSCAAGMFSGISKQTYDTYWFWTNPEHVEALVEWLKEGTGVKIISGGYNPAEFLFLMPMYRTTTVIKALAAHPLVKQVDGWTNKAHSDTPLGLFRLSLKGDFKK